MIDITGRIEGKMEARTVGRVKVPCLVSLAKSPLRENDSKRRPKNHESPL
jgi:hypothetical protein